MLIRVGFAILFATLFLYCGLVWWCASELAEPPRRQPQTASRPYLDGSAKAGFRVEGFVSSGGMPYSVCVSEQMDKLSDRASTIWQQLLERGLEVVPSGDVIGTILILHGRGGVKEDYFPVAERFCAAGFRCVIPDLPGHGANQEEFSTYGVTEAEKVIQCFTEASQKFGFSGHPSAVFGQSMGGSIAVHVAALEGSPFGSMAVVSSFDRLETVVREKTNGLLGTVLGSAVRKPASMLFAVKTGIEVSAIRPMDRAAGIRIPTMVVHGDSDRFIPISSGSALFDSFPESIEKEWVPVPAADHNNVLITDFPLYATIAEWFLKNLR